MSYPTPTTFTLPPFKPRSPKSSTPFKPSSHKRYLRRLAFGLPLAQRHAVDTSNARHARIRIWRREPRQRLRQLKKLTKLNETVVKSIEMLSERSLALFALTARLHDISIALPTFEPRPAPAYVHLHRRSLPVTSDILHIAPLHPVSDAHRLQLAKGLLRGLKRKRK